MTKLSAIAAPVADMMDRMSILPTSWRIAVWDASPIMDTARWKDLPTAGVQFAPILRTTRRNISDDWRQLHVNRALGEQMSPPCANGVALLSLRRAKTSGRLCELQQ